MIHPQVHRTLNQTAIKNYLKDKGFNINLISQEINIDLKSDLGYSHLLDHLLDIKEIKKSDLDSFLIEQLNYGRMKNVYIKFIERVDLLKDEKHIRNSIEKLNQQFKIEIPNNINKSTYLGNLKSSIPIGIKRVLYYDIQKARDGIPEKFILLIGSCIKDKNSNLCNHYASIEVDIENKVVQIRLRNWETDTVEKSYSVDREYFYYAQLLEDCFEIITEVKQSKTQKMIYKMTEDLISAVLNPTEIKVNKLLQSKIKSQIDDLSKCLFGQSYKLPVRESNVIKELILNNFYKLSLLKELNGVKITDKYLRDKGVEGYPRYIKFFDDTIGEGKAKSQTSKESVLTTDVFYDNRARLKQSNNICFSTIYWLSTPKTKQPYGISFYLDRTNTADKKYFFKYIVKNHFFYKEQSDYVLQKIIEYY